MKMDLIRQSSKKLETPWTSNSYNKSNKETITHKKKLKLSPNLKYHKDSIGKAMSVPNKIMIYSEIVMLEEK